jgi:hypothetical protein
MKDPSEALTAIGSLSRSRNDAELTRRVLELWTDEEFAKADGQLGRMRYSLVVSVLKRIVTRHPLVRSALQDLRGANKPLSDPTEEWRLRNALALNVVLDETAENLRWFETEFSRSKFSSFTIEMVENYMMPILVGSSRLAEAGNLIGDPVRLAANIVVGVDPKEPLRAVVAKELADLMKLLRAAERSEEIEAVRKRVVVDLGIIAAETVLSSE